MAMQDNRSLNADSTKFLHPHGDHSKNLGSRNKHACVLQTAPPRHSNVNDIIKGETNKIKKVIL